MGLLENWYENKIDYKSVYLFHIDMKSQDALSALVWINMSVMTRTQESILKIERRKLEGGESLTGHQCNMGMGSRAWESHKLCGNSSSAIFWLYDRFPHSCEQL